MSIKPRITVEHIDRSTSASFIMRRKTDRQHDGEPVWQTVRGRYDKAIALGETNLMPVRIGHDIEKQRTHYATTIGALLGLGGKTDIETVSVDIVMDNGTVLYGNDADSIAAMKAAFPLESESLSDTSLLVRAETHDVRGQLFPHRHALGLPLAHRSADDVRESLDETIPPALNYSIAKDTVPAWFRNGNADNEYGMREFLEQKLDLATIWKRLCVLTGRTKPIPHFDIMFNTRESAMGAAICSITDVHYRMNEDGRRKATSFSSTPMYGLALSMENHNFDMQELENTVVHELGHMLTNDVPHNELVREGLAELIVSLYGEVFDRPHVSTFGSPSVRPLGSATPDAMCPPNCADPLGTPHTAFGWAGASMFLQTLGATLDERLGNLKHLMTASGTKTDGQSVTTVTYKRKDGSLIDEKISLLPTIEEWLAAIDREQPGLGRAIGAHPTMQPMTRGRIAQFFPKGKEGSAWGAIAAFDYQPNEHFGHTRPLPRHLPVSPLDYDLNAGSTTPLTIALRATNEDGTVEAKQSEGYAYILPQTFCRVSNAAAAMLQKGARIEYRIGDGQWECLAENATMTDADIRARFAALHDGKKSRKIMRPVLRKMKARIKRGNFAPLAITLPSGNAPEDPQPHAPASEPERTRPDAPSDAPQTRPHESGGLDDFFANDEFIDADETQAPPAQDKTSADHFFDSMGEEWPYKTD